MNTQNKRKIIGRVALVLALLTILALCMTGCGSNTAINTKAPEKGFAEYEANLNPSEKFIDKLLSYIGIFLAWLTKVIPPNSYIITLFIFAILMEILLLPFAIKQQKNSIKQARLRPKEMAIRKKYAGRNDQATQQKVTQEIQELYQKENFNPMAGCLQLLIQFPIIIVLYWLVVDPIKYAFGGSGDFNYVLYHFIQQDPASFGGGISSSNGSIEIFSKIKEFGPEAFEGIKTFCANGADVYDKIVELYNAPATFNIGPVNFGLTPQEQFGFNTVNSWLIAIPILTFFAYFFSMKINRKLQFQPTQSADDRQQACSNNMMDITMPLLSVWMAFAFPAALGVYWIFKSIIGVGKQFVMSKAMPLPKFTEEDYKEAEKEILGKQQPKKIVKSENAGKVRSLHHIDDEDYDEKGNYRPVQHEKEVIETVAEEKIADNKMTEGASLKDETDKADMTEKKPRLFGKKDKKD